MSNNTLEDDRYAVIKLGPGPAPADAVMIGAPFSEVLANIPDTHARTDSIRTYQAAKIDAMKIDQMQKATRAIQVATFCDSVGQIANRLDALESRVLLMQRRRRVKMPRRSNKRYKIFWTRCLHPMSRLTMGRVARCTHCLPRIPARIMKATCPKTCCGKLQPHPVIILRQILRSSRIRNDPSTNRCPPFRLHRKTIIDPPSASCVALGFC